MLKIRLTTEDVEVDTIFEARAVAINHMQELAAAGIPVESVCCCGFRVSNTDGVIGVVENGQFMFMH